MSDAPGKAVFLSYASQDAEAARRICESLRARGVEVWFDVEGGLETGDAWDQKIRRQIKECVLFIAVISKNTQAREEGYFRIEWELAAQRALGIAAGVAFILPVVIDDTREPEALVPDRFRAVQWTRLPGGAMAPEVQARFLKLWSHRAGVVRHGENTGRATSAPRPEELGGPQPVQPRKFGPVVIATLIAAALAAGGFLWLKRAPEAAPGLARETGGGARPPDAAVAPLARAWPRDPNLRRAIALVNGTESTLEDFALAEEIAKKVLAQDSTAPEAVTVMARVQVSFLYRGFDVSDERRALARRHAERAVQLGPDDPEALAALGIFLLNRGADLPRARELLERAVALRPDEPFFHRFRDRSIFDDLKVPTAEALAASERTAARFPNDALAHYELARHYRDAGRLAEMERELDRTLAITPLPNALVWKARLALLVRADPAEMKAIIERVPARTRSSERAVFSRWIHALVTGQAEEGLRALDSLTNKWIDDFDYIGPTALLAAQLLELQGRPELARAQYAAALADVQVRKARNPADYYVRVAEAWVQHGLGRDEEARALNRGTLEGLKRPYRFGMMGDWWFTAIPASLLTGDRATALELLREAVATSADAGVARRVTGDSDVARRLAGAEGGEAYAAEARAALRLRFKLDPRMAPFRTDREIVALLAEPALSPGRNGATAETPSEGATLTTRALALYTRVGFTREDLGVAEEFARRATDQAPDSAAAWGVRAGVQAAWVFRNWDGSAKRREETQALANRALVLDPNEPEALLARAHLLIKQQAFDQAESLIVRALTAHPGHVRLARARGFALALAGRADEARTVLAEAVGRAPRDPLLRYELAMSYADYGFVSSTPGSADRAIEQLDAAIALQPFSSALLLKAILLAAWRDDLSGMRAVLDQHAALPLVDRTEDRAVCVAMWAGLLEHRLDRVEAAAALTARSYFEDTVMILRPKDWLLALARLKAGKTNSARTAWQNAAAVLRQRMKDEPSNQRYQVELATTLAWLGESEEASRLVGPVEAIWKENPAPWQDGLLARYYAALGDARQTEACLRRGIDSSPFTSRSALARDPWWDKVRSAPEFERLLEGRQK